MMNSFDKEYQDMILAIQDRVKSVCDKEGWDFYALYLPYVNNWMKREINIYYV